MVRSAPSRSFLVLASCVLALTPMRALAQAPPPDPFLGVSILTTGASAPGAPVVVNNSVPRVSAGASEPGLTATNLATGYDASVLDPIRNFSAAPFSFAVTGVTNANGTPGAGGIATGRRVDISGNPLAGGGGTFTVNPNGTFSFAPGADFADLDVGDEPIRVAVNYQLHGDNSSNGQTRDFGATLYIDLERLPNNSIQQTPAIHSVYGSKAITSSSNNVFPDLQGFVQGLLRFEFAGGAASPLNVINTGNITTTGLLKAHGISATTIGARGYDGRDASVLDSSLDGGEGGIGGTITLSSSGNISTVGEGAVGIFAWSAGGDGGQGGDSGYTRNSKAGGPAGTGGTVIVNGSGLITTIRNNASGVLAFSQGGNGGGGGDGSTFNGAENGANGGRGGTVIINGSWNITTSGNEAHGMWGKSFGGVAGSGGDGGWTGTSSGNGGFGTEGGSVSITSAGLIRTMGDDAYGLFGQSIGGFGGDGGSGTSIFYATGGSGEKAGSGGAVSITNNGRIETIGVRSHGIFAESVGGGGGTGGDGSALAGLGGSGAGGGDAGAVAVVNNGVIIVAGADARGIYAQSVGGGGGDGGDGAGLVGIGGKGSATSDGGTVAVTNTGSITSASNAIFAQSVGGGGGDGGSAAGLISIGGDGGAGGNADVVTISSKGNLTTTADEDATAIFAQSVGGGGGNGGNSVAVGPGLAAAIGGKGGTGGLGRDVRVGMSAATGLVDPVTGLITTAGESSHGIQAQSVGGGGGNGGFAFAGSAGPGASAALALGGEGGSGNRAASASVYFGDTTSRISTTGANANGIFAQSVGGGGGNGGLSISATASTGVAVGLSMGGDGGTGADAGLVVVGDLLNPLRGVISTTGQHSYGVLAQSIGGGGGNGGMSVSVAVGGKAGGAFAFGGDGGVAGAGSAVTLVNAARVATGGANSHGLFAQSVGGGGGSGGASIAAGISGGNTLALSFGGKGAGGGSADAVTLTSSGLGITTLGAKSYGILAQSIGGGGGDGGFAVSGGIGGSNGVNIGIGGEGGTASHSGIVTVTNASSIATIGSDSHGLFAQSAGGGGGSGGFSVAGGVSKSGSFNAAVGGGGGAGGNGNNLIISNTAATVQTSGDRAYGILGQSVGGGGGDGGFAIAGGISQSNSVQVAIGGAGGSAGHAGTVTLTSSAAITTSGELAHGILAQSVGGGGGTGGFAISGAVSSQNAMSVSIGGNGGSANYADLVRVANTGAITTGGDGSGQGSYGILAQSIGGSGGAGGFSGAFTGTFGGKSKGKSLSLSLSIGGEGGSGGNGGLVDLTNSGLVFTKAADSVGLYAQSVGGGGGNGGFSLAAALSTSADAYDIGVSIGGGGNAAGNASTVTLLNNAGVQTLGDHSHGIQAQSIGGGGGNGGFSVSATGGTGKQTKSATAAVGGTGGAGGDALDVTVTNNASIATRGLEAHGIQAQSLGGGGGNGGFAISGTLSGESGKSLSIALGGDGGAGGTSGVVSVLGSGGYSISTEGARSAGIQALSLGGGGGNGGFSGAVSLGEGGSQPGKGSTSISISVGGDGGGGDISGAVNVGSLAAALRANIVTSGVESVGIQAQSIGGGGGNGGFSFAGSANAVPSDRAPNTNIGFAVGGGGGNGDNAAAVLVRHEGSIFTSGDAAHGIEAQSIGGGGGNAGGAHTLILQLGPPQSSPNETKEQKADRKKNAASNKSLAVSIGGTGGGASDGSTVTVDHVGDVTTLGANAHGIFAQSIGGGGGSGGDADEGLPSVFGLPLLDVLEQRLDRSANAVSGKDISIIVGGSGGSSGNGDVVRVTNDGHIRTHSDGSHGVFAQSIGGGGGAGGNGQLGAQGTIGIGGGTGSTGDGGTVFVGVSGAIDTLGDASHAIFAQSIGGGGGAAGDVDRGLKNYANVGIGLAFGRGSGNGGDGATVTVNSTADLFTIGSGAAGVFAQSIGGGGGVAGELGNDLPLLGVLNFAGSVGGTGSADMVNVTQTGNVTTLGDAADGIFAQSAGGQQTGGEVNVTLTSGDIVVSGAESNGIFAQSTGIGGRDNITITIADADSVVIGGTNTGAGVRFADGATNTLVNKGTVTTMAGLAGTSIVGGAGNETIQNFGTVNGSIDLGGGVNTFNNLATGVFNTGTLLALGSTSTLNNAGTLSSGGWTRVQTTTVDGSLMQIGTPTWHVDLGADGASDRLAMTGSAQFGASVTTLDLNPLTMPTSGSSYTLATAAAGLGGSQFEFGTYYGEMPLGLTFATTSSNTSVELTVTPSTGVFRWTGGIGTSWGASFIDGVSNWASSAAGSYVYGTPGAAVDVAMGNSAGFSELGANLAINSLRFDSGTGVPGAGDTSIGGNHTLTLLARDGAGITLAPGSLRTLIGVNLILGGDQTWSHNGSGLLAIVGNSITGAGRNLTIAGSGTTLIQAGIQIGSGGLTKVDDGLLILTGNNSYSGGTVVEGGTLLASTESLQGAIVNNATVAFDQSSDGEYDGVMSGTGLLIKQGDGALTLGGANVHTGGTAVVAGTLRGTTTSLQGEILNLGTLIFDQAGTGAYEGSLFGTGSLVLRGGGRFEFTGNSGAFAGNTTLVGSQLVVNGWLGGGRLTAQAGATVGGNGVIPSTLLQSGATLAPGNSIGSILVNGNVTFEAGSNYQVETEAYGPSDQMLISGAVVATGGVVDVRAGGEKRYRPINFYTIARSGSGIMAPFAGVKADASYLTPSLQYDARNVYLTLRRNDVDFRVVGTHGNQSRVAEVFNELVATATGAFADSINSVYDLSDADAREAFTSMTGVLYQHTARAGLTTAQTFNSLAMRRLDLATGDGGDTAVMADIARGQFRFAGAEDGFSRPGADVVRPIGLWASGLGGVSRFVGSAGDPGARVPLVGFAVGFDTAISEHTTLGVSGGQARPEVFLNDVDDATTSEVVQFGAYGRFRRGGSRVDGAIGFGSSTNDVSRRVTDGTSRTFARASFDGSSVASQLEYGYGIEAGAGIVIEPQAGYQYGRVTYDGSTEAGANILNLIVPDRRVPSQRSLAGVRLSKSFGGEQAVWMLEGRASWAHEFSPLQDLRLRFTGDEATEGFALASASALRDSAVVGLSIAGREMSGFRIAGSIDAEVSGPMSGWTGNVIIGKSW